MAPVDPSRRPGASAGHEGAGYLLVEAVDNPTLRSRDETVAESEARFRSVFESSPIGIAVVGLDGAWLRINPAVCGITGYTEAELHASDFQSITHPDDLAADLHLVEQLLAGTIPSYQMHKRYLRRDGRAVWCLLSVTLLRDETGAPLHFLSQIVDVDAERTAGGLVDALFAASADAMVVTALDGRVLRANAAWSELLGVDEATLQTSGLLRRLHPRDVASLAAAVERSPDGRIRPLRIQLRLRHRDGSYRWLDWRVDAVQGADLIVATARDVTEQKAREAQAQRERERLERTIAVQREVLATQDPAAMLQLVADRTGDVLAAATGAVVELLDGEGLRYAAVARALAGAAGAKVPVAGSLSGLSISRRATMRCDDTQEDGRVHAATCQLLGITSMLVAPVYADGVAVGALKATSHLRGAFTDADEQQLTLLADALSGGLRQASDAARATSLMDRARHAMSALAASEARFHSAFAGSPLGMVLTSLAEGDAGTCLLANPAMTRITGRPVADLVGSHVLSVVHADDRAAADRELAALAAGDDDAVAVQVRIVHLDGRPIWVDVHGAVVRGEGGEAQHLVLQLQDVTEQRRLHAELAERARLLDLAQDAIVVRSLDGRIRYWNPGAERLYGWPAAVAIGHHMDRLLDTRREHEVAAAEVLGQLLAIGSWEGEVEHRRSDGNRVLVLSRKALLRGPEGEPMSVLTISSDITDRRAAEVALASSEQMFRSQFLHAGIGMIIRGADGYIQRVNPAIATMLDCAPEELVGRHVTSVFSSGDAQQWPRWMAEVFSGERDSFEGTGWADRADGTRVPVHTSVAVIRDADGQPERFIGIYQDISARVAAESARDAAVADLAERNRALEATNQLRADLMGMLGHEIGNPMATILGYTEMAADRWDLLDATDQRGLVATIDRNARRVEVIVREVLALVAIDAGRLTAVPQSVVLREHLVAAAAGTAARVACPAGLEAWVEASHLDHVLTNLVSNATKYGGGPTLVSAHTVGDAVVLRVEDEGPGIAEPFAAHVFERFSRDPGTAGNAKGTGLGLHIVQQLVAANGGQVRYEDAPGGGAAFVVTLPA